MHQTKIPGNNRRTRAAARTLAGLPSDLIIDLAVAALGRAHTRRDICDIAHAARLALSTKPSRYGQEGGQAA